MAVTTSSTATIRGISYSRGQSFVCQSAEGGGSNSEGGSAAALTKGRTYYFYSKASGDAVVYPYSVSTDGSAGNINGWYKESVFPYATYSVKLYSNGGTFSGGGTSKTLTKTYGTNLSLSSYKPTRTNYEFLGWSTSSSATSASYSPSASWTSNSATSLYAVWKLLYTAPSAPSGISITKNSDTSATVKWTNNPASLGGLTGTYIYRETNGSVGSTNINNTTSNSQTSFTDTATTTNNRYRYKLVAYNDYGNATAAYTGYIYTTPAAPQAGYGMNNNGNVTLNATVSNINYASSYEWQRSQTSDFASATTLSLTSASGTDSHSLTGDVYYRVRAVAPDGTKGAWRSFLCGNRVSLYFWIPG